MFTHFGITGPVVLSGSTRIAPYLKKGTVTAEIDMKPSLTEEQLDARLLRDFDKNMNKQIRMHCQNFTVQSDTCDYQTFGD